MKILIASLILLGLSACVGTTHNTPFVHTSDIQLFWKAYDDIVETEDLKEQYRIIQEDYIEKGSKGLKAIMNKRRYTADSYIKAINNSPKFWKSIRENTMRAPEFAGEITTDLLALQKLYPDFQSADVYFTVGALQTGGTAHKGHVLIGAEIAMADSTAIVDDLKPERLKENLGKYFRQNPIDDLVLLNVHEYVHTQQGDYGNNLLSMAVFEGVAEFVSVLAAKRPSSAPAVLFGKKNAIAVRDRFAKEMFSPHWNDWLYNDFDNEFGVRDLGYYVGYAICENYYNNAESKKLAIKQMIELDCSNAAEVREFVTQSGYFGKTLKALETEYLTERPAVLGIKEFQNRSKQVDPDLKTVTVQFSREMNSRFRNFKIGTRGEKRVLPYNNITWSEDHKSLILDVELEPNKRYQLTIDDEFRDPNGRNIDKYTIDFTTSK